MTPYRQYPRFYVRAEENGVNKIAKAETPDEASAYTVERGWYEYGTLLSGGVHTGAQAGHTMGVSVEGEE